MSHVGGQVELAGDDALAQAVVLRALAVTPDEASTMAHVHGFHSYPARLHPGTAALLVEGLSRGRDTVLDPFAGSGTVLVEARRLGRRPVGVDANPLAVELARLKTRSTSEAEREALREGARRVAAEAETRRVARAGATRSYGPRDRELFDPHILFELDGLRHGISTLVGGDTAGALWLVLSALLVKVSRKPGDTAVGTAPRRLASGFAIRFFEKKADELTRRLEAYAALVPARAPRAVVHLGDARELGDVGSGTVALVATSPPYPGVYDYHAQHAPRLRWLGLDGAPFAAREIGARRHAQGQSFDGVVRRYRADLATCLAELRRVLEAGGYAALVLADSAVAGRALRLDRLVRELASEQRLALAASGSQARPHFHGPSADAFRGEPRREHLLVLRKA